MGGLWHQQIYYVVLWWRRVLSITVYNAAMGNVYKSTYVLHELKQESCYKQCRCSGSLNPHAHHLAHTHTFSRPPPPIKIVMVSRSDHYFPFFSSLSLSLSLFFTVVIDRKWKEKIKEKEEEYNFYHYVEWWWWWWRWVCVQRGGGESPPERGAKRQLKTGGENRLFFLLFHFSLPFSCCPSPFFPEEKQTLNLIRDNGISTSIHFHSVHHHHLVNWIEKKGTVLFEHFLAGQKRAYCVFFSKI